MKLALGTVQFGLPYGIANQSGQVTVAEAGEILKLAGSSGIDMLDTAVVYGESEQRLGEIGVQGWRIVSKLPAVPEDCLDLERWMAEALNGSLQRLKVSGLYGLLLHRPQQLLESRGERLYQALQQLKQAGVVEKIGISIYGPAELAAICSRFPIDLVQAPFNVLDRRLIDSGWLARLAEQGTEVHVRSIFLQGLLLMAANDRDRKFARWQSLWSDWDNWLRDQHLTPLQACLRHALSFPEIGRVVVGVDSRAQLREILGAATGALPELPAGLACSDVDLLNPARWAALA